MPDSPKCPLCFESGILSQTYKVAGKGKFMCAICKNFVPLLGLDPKELLWKERPSEWKDMMNKRIELKDKKVRTKLFEQLEKVGKK